MTVPVVLAIAGVISIFISVWGGGIKAKEIEIPPAPVKARYVIGFVGLVFISISIWLSTANIITPPNEIQPNSTSTTPIPNLQVILLRGTCGSDYIVNANEPISIYYGGWGVKGIDLVQQWVTSFTASITIDGTLVSGEQHPPANELPLNCTEDKEDVYWIFYTTTLSGFSPGVHEILVTYNTLRALPDELGGKNYESGKISDFTFKITAK